MVRCILVVALIHLGFGYAHMKIMEFMELIDGKKAYSDIDRRKKDEQKL